MARPQGRAPAAASRNACSFNAAFLAFMMNRIALLGTGLVGGSLGLVLRDRRPDLTVIGYDRPEVLERAEERGALTDKAAHPAAAVESADLVVLATPAGASLQLLDTIADALTAATIVTDVASVKQPILDQAAEVLPDDVPFVGGHPMAGAEHAGIDHADPLLFENAAWVLCLPDALPEAALENDLKPVVDMIETAGGRPLLLDAASHDRIAGLVSHLPQLVAVALVNTVADTPDPDTALQLAAGGFRDMTRIAASPFSMWRDVLVGNESAIHDALSQFTRRLQTLRNRLLADDLDALDDAFTTAKDARESIPREAKGFLHPLADVYVQVPDAPGMLHTLTGCLADAGLNIKDIELQKFRGGAGGTFRIGFETSADAEEAVAVLNEQDYTARRP
jgi:prephenate dehydrogenase